MQTKHFLAVAASGLVASAVAGGCSSDVDETGGGGTGGTGTGTTTTTTIVTTTTTTDTGSTTSTTTGTGDGNDSFAEAVETTVDATAWTEAELDPPDTDVDYFSFQGTEGQAIYILTDCKPDDDPYAEGYPDLVVTLFDSSEAQIAQNDDPFPRTTQDAHLMTVLPSTGTYYIKVEEFCASLLGQGKEGCTDYFPSITETAYGLVVFSMDGAEEGNVDEAGTEPNDTTANAVSMEYAPVDGQTGSYYLTAAWGDFASGTDVDFYEINLPDDLDLGGAAPVISVTTLPGGTEGNGSTAEVGMLTLFAADGTTKVAEVDASLGGDISPPGNVADTYFLSVTRKGTTPGAHDFYFLMHSGTAYENTAEVEPNDVYGEATVLTADCQATTVGTSCYAQGTLSPGGADAMDHFRFTAESGQLVSVACGAQRSGSGLRGLSLELLDGADGTAIANTEAGPEADDFDLVLEDASLGGVTNVVLQLTATSQAVDVTSNFYRCGIHLQDP